MTEDTPIKDTSADDERKEAELRIARLINESIDEIDAGAECVDGEEFFESLRIKYGSRE